MHVLHVTATEGGGVLRHVLALVRGCLARGRRTSLVLPVHRITSRPALAELAALRDAGLRVTPCGIGPRIHPFHYVRAALCIRSYVRAHGVSLVHAHSSRAGALVRLLPRMLRSAAPIVYTPNAFSFLLPTSPLNRRLFLSLERAAVSATAALVAVSPSERELAAERVGVPGNRLHEIANGVSIPPLDLSEVTAKRASGRPLRVFSAGRLSRQKNPLLFVEIAERVCASRSEVQFRWAGAGEMKPLVDRRLARSPFGDRIRFLGYLDDVRDELTSASVYLSTASYEGLPYAGLDALAYALPIVVSDVWGNRDLVPDGRNGVRYPTNDPDAGARAILRLLDDPNRLRSAARVSREIAAASHDIEDMLDRHDALYQTLEN